MAKILESYKSENGQLIEQYTLKNKKGETFNIKQTEKYSIQREVELLKELKSSLVTKLMDYPNLCINTNKDIEKILTGVTIAGLSIAANANLIALLSLVGTLKVSKTFVKECKEVRSINKKLNHIDECAPIFFNIEENLDENNVYASSKKILNKKYK